MIPTTRSRRFLAALSIAAAFFLVVSALGLAGHGSQRNVPLTEQGIPLTPNYVELTPREQFRDVTVLDLSHSIRNGIPTFFGPFTGHENVILWEDGFYANQLTMFENTGTQIDSPAHFVEGALALHELDVHTLSGVAIHVDLRDVVAESGDPNYAITAEDLQAWEESSGVDIGEGHIVLIETGWHQLWDSFVVGENDAFTSGFPGLAPSGAEYLVDQGIRGWGIDTTSQDPAVHDGFFPAHVVMGEAGIWGLENLDDLNRLPTFSFVIVGPAKIKGPSGTASGGPARVWSLYDRSNPQAFAERLDGALQDADAFDLTHTLENGIPTFSGTYDGINEPFGYDDGFLLTHLGTLTEHTGTHLDAPAHFAKGHAYLDQVPLRQLAGVVVVVDASGMLTDDNRVTASEIVAWEADTGLSIDAGEMVFFATGWGDRWDDFVDGTSTTYRSEDWPALTEDAAELLVRRGIAGAGIDTLSIDPAPSTTFPVHRTLNGADIWIVENLADMLGMGLGDQELFATAMPWMIWHGSGAPVRVLLYDLPTEGGESFGVLLILVDVGGQGPAAATVPGNRGRGLGG